MSARLRQARKAHGWSQERLVHEIERYARQHSLDVASTASLRVYVSEWENNRRPIGPLYAAVLRALLGLTDRELLGRTTSAEPVTVTGYDELIGRIDSAHNLSLGMVDTFMAQTELLRTVDRQMGAAALVDQMQAHLAALEECLTFAVLPSTREPIARALAGAATLGAWQALDVGATERAWRHYELGKRAAAEAKEPMYLAHAMAEQAYVLSAAGKSDLAVQLVQEAHRTVGGKASPRLLAWLHAAEAELLAQAGRPDDCRRSLDRAAAVLPPGDTDRDPDMLSVFLNGNHLTRWRGNVLARLGDDAAMSDLYDALAGMDATFTRAAAGLHCDLAQAHLAREEQDQAVNHLRKARLLANRTGSARHRARIDQLGAKF
ncbi:helix-turn-helix transcriptional regulator [Kitasatospora aureofaciens]|uniref:helix-turn-helix domain-containing protein n=1 Tax=Kitasatospora aureofaciens TaxID=1894 RepID=UPI001C4750FB|nr:helix-turn-helix transcriptional regulator [Kitasatospora aureofaciens]MBV6700597.1 helix-turn-helix transcriptional regulator [Kitasatospora aureofaciens]